MCQYLRSARNAARCATLIRVLHPYSAMLVLEGLATAVNHRRWFVELALPFLGDDPIQIGSGLGDYALEWAPHFSRFTATEADPGRLVALKERLGGYDTVDIRQMLLPTDEVNTYSGAVSYNVLEHIEDHVTTLRSMARLVRPGGRIVLIVPAFPFAMSPVDIATGHVRRYTKKTMRQALTEAGLAVEELRYARSDRVLPGHQRVPADAEGRPIVKLYDRLVLPATRAAERLVRPPFGQSVFAVARVPD